MNAPSTTGRLLFSTSNNIPSGVAPRSLGRYIVWRLLGMLVIAFVFLTLVFYAVEVVPVDPTRFLIPRGGSCSTADPFLCTLRTDLIQHWGLNGSLLDRYVIFLTNMLTGNYGPSVTVHPGTPIWDLIAPTLAASLSLIAASTLILAVLSLLAGIRLSRKRGGAWDLLASLLLAMPFAIPTVVLGFVALYLFAVVYKVFPLIPAPQVDPLTDLANGVWYGVLPFLVLIATSVGLFTWVVRDHPLRPATELQPLPPGEWRTPRKTRTARLLGALPRFLAAMPILFPWMLSASLVSESVFRINGAGNLLWRGILTLDFFLIASLVTFVTLVIVLPTIFVADVLHYWLTARWDREDGISAEAFQIDARDLVRVPRKVLVGGLGLVGLMLILLLAITTAAAAFLAGPYPTPTALSAPFLSPSPEHLLGTDEQGRDLFTLLLYGGQQATGVAVLAFALALAAGLALVAAIGFLGERSRVFLTIPVDLSVVISLPFVMLFVETAPGSALAIWAPAFLGWPIATRLLLLETTGLVSPTQRSRRTEASLHDRGTWTLNLLWGTGPLILADAFLAVSFATLAWAILGFTGLGLVGPGTYLGWGQILNNAYNYLAILRGQWWYFAPPIEAIFLAALGPVLVSLGLKEIGFRIPRPPIRVEAPPAGAHSATPEGGLQ